MFVFHQQDFMVGAAMFNLFFSLLVVVVVAPSLVLVERVCSH